MKNLIFLLLFTTCMSRNSFTQNWLTTGNTLTGSEKIGAINNKSVDIITNNIVRIKVGSKGNIGVGLTTLTNTDKFSVKHTVSSPTGVYTLTKGIYSEVTGYASADYNNIGVGVYGICNSNNNWGYGGWFVGDYIGVVGAAEGNASIATGVSAGAISIDGWAYGLSARAISPQSNYNYGVYAYSEDAAISNVGLMVEGPITTGVAAFIEGSMEYTGALYDVSDAKFKTNVLAIDNAMEKINRLQPKSYSFAHSNFPALNFGNEYEYGFIAQELEEIFPELVKDCILPVNPYNQNEPALIEPFEYKAVNYIGLIPILTKALQEQHATISTQNLIINNLEKRLSVIEQENKMHLSSTSKSEAAWMEQNSPNPFSTTTTIRYSIPQDAISSTILIADLTGNVIAQYPVSTGQGTLNISDLHLVNSNYVYTLIVDNNIIASKLLTVAK